MLSLARKHFLPLNNVVKILMQWQNQCNCDLMQLRGEWPSGLYSLRQVTEVKLGRVRSDFGWVTSED